MYFYFTYLFIVEVIFIFTYLKKILIIVIYNIV